MNRLSTSAVRPAQAARAVLALSAALILSACAGGGGKPASLAGTYWNVTEVGAQTFKAAKGQREAHLRLDAQNKRATGYSGVNSFSGAYETRGTSLKFGPLAATRRAGKPAAMTFESAYFKALGATRAYQISGDALELIDAEGNARVRLEALPAL